MIETIDRAADLRRLLEARRREIETDVRSRARDGRSGRRTDVWDAFEQSDAAIQDDFERSLIQMRTETAIRIDAALVRLAAGQYGLCFDCECEIPERRLRALPFAVRCQACEERREEHDARARWREERRSGFSLFEEGLPL
jgi:DnaK suppressor protein